MPKIEIPDRHLQKFVSAVQGAEIALAARDGAQRTLTERNVALQRAAESRESVIGLIYELVGAPDTAVFDLQQGTIAWPDVPEAPSSADVSPRAE